MGATRVLVRCVMKKKTGITIYDLATELNLSPSTVSRALHDHPSIGKETIKTIKELARARGYRRNIVAANLRNQETTNIGIITPRIDRPFLSGLISGAEKAAREAGYQMLISQSQDSYAHEIDNTKALFDSRVCGLIVSLAMETRDYSHFKPFMDSDTPVVFADRIPPVQIKGHKVMVDNYKAGFMATEHLIEQGCRRIAHLGGALSQQIYIDRRQGYIDALRAHGLPIEEAFIINGSNLSAEEGFRFTNVLLDLPIPPDGLFAANDTAAVSAIRCAKSRGVRIPDELAIIGFNNDPVCQIIEPELSSLGHPAMDMGRLAVEQLLAAMHAEVPIPYQTTILETELVVRASTKRR